VKASSPRTNPPGISVNKYLPGPRVSACGVAARGHGRFEWRCIRAARFAPTFPQCKANITLCHVYYTFCHSQASLCVSPLANSAAVPPLSRLASPVPRRSGRPGGTIHGPLETSPRPGLEETVPGCADERTA